MRYGSSPARDDHLPVQRIRKVTSSSSRKRESSAVDIDAAVGFGAVHIIVAAADGQLIQAGLRDGEIPPRSTAREAPVFSADGIHFYGVYVVRGGHGRGPVIDRIQHGGGFAVCCPPCRGESPRPGGMHAVRRQIIRIIRSGGSLYTRMALTAIGSLIPSRVRRFSPPQK